MCRAGSLYVLEAVRGKETRVSRSTRKRCVHYLCHWEGYGTDGDTWEPLANIPTGSKAKALIGAYNTELRKRAREE